METEQFLLFLHSEAQPDMPVDQTPHGALEIVWVHGFADEVCSSALECHDCALDVAVTCKEEDRNGTLLPSKNLLQFKAAHAGHSDVEYETSRAIGIVLFKKICCAFKFLHHPTVETENEGFGFTNANIVVNNAYDRIESVGHDFFP